MLEGLFGKDNSWLLILLVLFLFLGNGDGCGNIFGDDNIIWIVLILCLCLGDGFKF